VIWRHNPKSLNKTSHAFQTLIQHSFQVFCLALNKMNITRNEHIILSNHEQNAHSILIRVLFTDRLFHFLLSGNTASAVAKFSFSNIVYTQIVYILYIVAIIRNTVNFPLYII